jgi:hypothetical protein
MGRFEPVLHHVIEIERTPNKVLADLILFGNNKKLQTSTTNHALVEREGERGLQVSSGGCRDELWRRKRGRHCSPFPETEGELEQLSPLVKGRSLPLFPLVLLLDRGKKGTRAWDI